MATSHNRKDSWTKHYDDVAELDYPAEERDRFLPSRPTTPTQLSNRHPSQLQHQGGMSQRPQQQEPDGASAVARTPRNSSFKSHPSSPLNPSASAPYHPQPFPSSSSTQSTQIPRTPSSLTTTNVPSASSSSASPPMASHPPFSSLGSPPHPQPPHAAASGSPPHPHPPFISSSPGRPGSRGSFTAFNRMPSDLTMTMPSSNGSPYPVPMSNSVGSRGSMILYRRAEPGQVALSPNISLLGSATPPLQTTHTGGTDASTLGGGGLLPPPPIMAGNFAGNRASVYSTSGDSFISMASDSKYPVGSRPASIGPGGLMGHGGGYGTERGLVAYAYDPDEDEESDDGEDDWLHDPDVDYPTSKVPFPTRRNRDSTSTSTKELHPSGGSQASHSTQGKGKLQKGAVVPVGRPGPSEATKEYPRYNPSVISWRGCINISTLVAMVAALLCLFAVYPMVRAFSDSGVRALISGNLRINATGQAEYDFNEGNNGGGAGDGGNAGPPVDLNPGGVIFDRRSVKWKRDEDWFDLNAVTSSLPSPLSSSSSPRSLWSIFASPITWLVDHLSPSSTPCAQHERLPPLSHVRPYPQPMFKILPAPVADAADLPLVVEPDMVEEPPWPLDSDAITAEDLPLHLDTPEDLPLPFDAADDAPPALQLVKSDDGKAEYVWEACLVPQGVEEEHEGGEVVIEVIVQGEEGKEGYLFANNGWTVYPLSALRDESKTFDDLVGHRDDVDGEGQMVRVSVAVSSIIGNIEPTSIIIHRRSLTTQRFNKVAQIPIPSSPLSPSYPIYNAGVVKCTDPVAHNWIRKNGRRVMGETMSEAERWKEAGLEKVGFAVYEARWDAKAVEDAWRLV